MVRTYMPGLTELEENKELGSTGVRLREFMDMDAPQRKEILVALEKEVANKVKSPNTGEQFVDPEGGFDDEAYKNKCKKTAGIFVQLMKTAMKD